MGKASEVMYMMVGVVVGLAALCWAAPLEGSKLDLSMPQVQPQQPDTYLCYPFQMGKTPLYITGFQPHANKSTAHHILIYGCSEPGDQKNIWNCGEMAAPSSDVETGPVCKSGAKIIYAWAMDAPDLKLPQDVAFKVGGESGINYLVLQVHYKTVTDFLPPENKKDSSGVTLETTETAQPKEAGVYLLGTGGELAPKSTTYMETACSYNEPTPLHPFAFRVHAHTHGEVVSGYRVRDGQWEEIGRESPQEPQMFYPISNPDMEIDQGDILAARCTMVNNEERAIAVGSTQNDEMCNFYIMYWTEGDHTIKNNYCFTDGPPTWDWSSVDDINAGAAPKSASIVPQTGKLLEESKQVLDKAEESMDQANEEVEEEFWELLQKMKEEGYFGDEDEDEQYPINRISNYPYQQQRLEEMAQQEYPDYDPSTFRRIMRAYEPEDQPNPYEFMDEQYYDQ